ncbi:MAG: hypothetical protein UHX00_10365 [Caryophanon sp.]|nr:hypothetical protein [Caryophanon sp.]
MRLLGEQLVPQDPVKRDAGAVRSLEPSPRKASRNTLLPIDWLINTLVKLTQLTVFITNVL